MTAEGEIIVMPPTYSLTGARNSRIIGQLDAWAERDGRGIACDSSTGFALPNGARRSPDAAWILKSRITQLDAASREKYWHLCPDFVVELQSSTDRPRILKDKMREWLANGAQLGWLIDPDCRFLSFGIRSALRIVWNGPLRLPAASGRRINNPPQVANLPHKIVAYRYNFSNFPSAFSIFCGRFSTPANRSPFSRNLSRAFAMLNSRGFNPFRTSSHSSGVATGAPG